MLSLNFKNNTLLYTNSFIWHCKKRLKMFILNCLCMSYIVYYYVNVLNYVNSFTLSRTLQNYRKEYINNNVNSEWVIIPMFITNIAYFIKITVLHIFVMVWYTKHVNMNIIMHKIYILANTINKRSCIQRIVFGF